MSYPVLALPSNKSPIHSIIECLVFLYMFSLSAKFIPVKTIILSCLLMFVFLSSLNAKISGGSFMCRFSSFLNFRSKSTTYSLMF